MEVKSLLKSLNEKPIVYHAIYARITGSVTAGILLSQILYWWSAKEGNEFYKTDKDWCDELNFGLWELKGAKEKIKQTGIVNIERKGNPAKTYYKINEKLLESSISSCCKNQQQEVLKNNNKLLEKPTTIYTENTSKITTEILQRLFDKEIQTDNLKEKQKFLDYWTEKNTDAKKERWQKQQAFDVKRRWKTWLDNCKEWGKEEKKKPYYFGDPVVEKFGKKYVIVDGEWKLFAGDKKDITWK